MQKAGEFNGFNIYVPGIGDVVLTQYTFDFLKHRLEYAFNMVPATSPNPEITPSPANAGNSVKTRSDVACDYCEWRECHCYSKWCSKFKGRELHT